jgi:hypothetical protein
MNGQPSNRTPRKFIEEVAKILLFGLRPRLFFDWDLVVTEGKMTFHARLDYQGYGKTAIDFQIDLNRLLENERDRLNSFFDLRYAGLTTRHEMTFILAWLLDLSIEQNAPNLTTEQREIRVLQSLLIVPQEQIERSNRLGVSPLLICVSRRARNQLQKKHGLRVEDLEHESSELLAGIQQFKNIPPGPYAQLSAEFYNRVTIAHHEKVKHLGELLGGQIGKALTIQAHLAIQELSSPL